MSRTIVGLLIALVAALSRIFKWEYVEADVREIIEIVVGLAGILIAWWGRMRTTGQSVGLFGKYKNPTTPLLLLPLLFLSACATQEDLTAVKATAEKLPVIIDASEKVYRDSIEALTKELRARAAAEVAQAADYELLRLQTPVKAEDGTLSIPPLDPAKVEAIIKKRDELNAKATAAIDGLYKAAMEHQNHKDMHLVAGLLRDYVLLRATIQEQTLELYKQAANLGGK